MNGNKNNEPVWHLLGLKLNYNLVTSPTCVCRSVSCADGLVGVNQFAELLLLLVRKLNLPCGPVLFEPLHLGCAGDGNHALRVDPRDGDLGRSVALLRGKHLDLIDHGLVLVKVFALEFGAYPVSKRKL